MKVFNVTSLFFVLTFEDCEEHIYPLCFFLFRSVLEKMTAYGHCFKNLVIAKRVYLDVTKVQLCCRINTLNVCFNMRIIDAGQYIRSHN